MKRGIETVLGRDGDELRNRLEDLLQTWRTSGVPPRWQLMNTLQAMLEWKDNERIPGLWNPPPLLLTATLDDGWGHGLEVVELCARVAGLQVERLGLLQTADRILGTCLQLRPRLLGLTILQFDSEPSLKRIIEGLGKHTLLLAGGPVFQIDPELASRTGVDHVAKDVADFLGIILNLNFTHS